MKISKYLLAGTLSIIFLISSCGGQGSNYSNEDESISSSDSTSITNNPSVDTSTSTTSGDDNSSSSESVVLPSEYSTIKKVNEISANLTNTNDVGIANSNELVKIEAKIYADLDSLTTQGNYGTERYKMLAIDNSGSLYLRINLTTREALKTYVTTSDESGSTLTLIGYPSLYRQENELLLYSYSVSSNSIDIDLDNVASPLTNIADVYEEIGKMKMNNKGRAYGKIVSVDVMCLHKLSTNDNNIIFIDNSNSLLVYDAKNFYNIISDNSTYKIYIAIQMYNFRPGAVLLKCTSIEKTSISFETFKINGLASNKTGSQFYETEPGKDYNPTSYPTNANYSNLFGKMYLFDGYINLYYKSGSAYMVLEDTYNENTYSAYTNAITAKALFINNSSEQKLYTSSEYNNSILYKALTDAPQSKHTIYVFPYEFNSNHYFQFEVLLNTLN